jgi:uncharacterized membrane protein HdeD (DUF308 family)
VFFVLPLLRWFARHPRGWIAIGGGVLLLIGGLAVGAVGIASHQPSITRIGLFALIISILYTTSAIRGRRPSRQDDAHPNHED